ncbi:uncharacterized protein GLRG_10868 [Colletotrichum graminicola M1.001]|uniref:Uncharacterized protein n=1 Tax=Colletotrichum graminicola (strain M1.001 / M2 / FGSC 10212) TaxID=645133 RepID=E3QXX5_COLGM|nr:uncharacterized protein GLRG_10868 [Colletotrichum graminicola M1.001]EFQ35713.1 hypothetical protein GLRG_10868 [Colletotrichum graminicola M1.001]
MTDKYDCKSIGCVAQERFGGTRAGSGTAGDFRRSWLMRPSAVDPLELRKQGTGVTDLLGTLNIQQLPRAYGVEVRSTADREQRAWQSKQDLAGAAACRGIRSKASTTSWLAVLPTGTASGEPSTEYLVRMVSYLLSSIHDAPGA